jgi:hypothetical protein
MDHKIHRVYAGVFGTYIFNGGIYFADLFILAGVAERQSCAERILSEAITRAIATGIASVKASVKAQAPHKRVCNLNAGTTAHARLERASQL